MPITRRQFELGIDDETEAAMRRVASFLAANSNEAYSIHELWEREFEQPIVEPSQELVDKVEASGMWKGLSEREQRFIYGLRRLVDLGVVRERPLGSATYYSAGRFSLDQVLQP